MPDGTYGIKGLPLPKGVVDKTNKIPNAPGTPMRVNISTLARDPSYRKQWTLFILALEKFKNIPVKEKLSYFQIAGIHVFPNQPWDGAPRPPAVTDGHIVAGYCFHNGLNFPTWHRPYMALFEQCVWDNMKLVIKDWVDKYHLPSAEADEWHAAADLWRLPYWDWAGQQSYVEDFATPEVLMQGPCRLYLPKIVKPHYPPSGLYANPFWSFVNPHHDEDGDPLPFGKMPHEAADWNIPPNPENQAPWDKVSGTSRYGLFRKLKKDLPGGASEENLENEESYDYRGIEGVNNAWQTNAIFSSMKTQNKWYDPDEDNKHEGKENPEDKDDKKKKDGKWEFTGPGSFSDGVSRLFSPDYHHNWEQFTSTKWYGDEVNTQYPTGYLSLEYIHNNVHNLTGGTNWDLGLGHMGDVRVAAFDPVFWLHHCQVDRVFAIWQALNWDKWWDGSPPVNKQDDDPEHHLDDRMTLLQPFHTKDNDPEKTTWTNDGCRNWTWLNYTYDDLENVAVKTRKADGTLDELKYVAALRKHLQELYPSSASVVDAIRKDPEHPTPVGLVPDSQFVGPGSGGGGWSDYIINVVYDRYALNGTAYSIEFYLGGPKAAQKTTFHPRNFVGRIFTFSNADGASSCPNCRKQQEEGVLSRGQVPLTIHLLHHVTDSISDHHLGSFDEDDVTAYLKAHLQWKFVRVGGDDMPSNKFLKTQVTVLRGVGEFVKVDDSQAWEGDDVVAHPVPIFSRYTALPQVTHNKDYGLQLPLHGHSRFLVPDTPQEA